MSDVGRKREMRDEEPRFVSFFFCGVCATCFVLIEMRGRTLVFPDFGGRRKIAWSREPGARRMEMLSVNRVTVDRA